MGKSKICDLHLVLLLNVKISDKMSASLILGVRENKFLESII